MPAEAYYSLESGYHANQLETSEREFRLMASERLRKLAAQVRPTDRVFEFGVGTGLNLALLPAAAKTGFDVGEHLRPAVESLGIEFAPEMDALPAHSFDVVLSHHSLEHVENPLGSLTAMRRLLKPDGRLLLFVPYEKERRYRTFRREEPNHHLYSWNPQTIGNLLEVSGFRVIACGCRAAGYERYAAGLAVRFGFRQAGYRTLLAVMRMIQKPEEIAVVAGPEPLP